MNANAPDFMIDFNANWFHNGEPIKREALVKLFAERALKIDDEGHYWLSTPFEKYKVAVEDVPFLIVDMSEKDGGFTFTTNIGETVDFVPDDRFEMRFQSRENMELPYLHIRDGLYARLSRSVFFEIVDKYGDKLFS
ncbi:MAG: DUF1285 domain-containing protein [Alphaproteobacteria bacterium]|nr:DUF1285 domain-containing protein [Alphaproteobacteria bacterium]MCD8570285.1 DUF1285 domain-containing protein [Alphaproteobacteria bacterium]